MIRVIDKISQYSRQAQHENIGAFDWLVPIWLGIYWELLAQSGFLSLSFKENLPF